MSNAISLFESFLNFDDMMKHSKSTEKFSKPLKNLEKAFNFKTHIPVSLT